MERCISSGTDEIEICHKPRLALDRCPNELQVSRSKLRRAKSPAPGSHQIPSIGWIYMRVNWSAVRKMAPFGNELSSHERSNTKHAHSDVAHHCSCIWTAIDAIHTCPMRSQPRDHDRVGMIDDALVIRSTVVLPNRGGAIELDGLVEHRGSFDSLHRHITRHYFTLLQSDL